jgi:hypothetical protein
MALTTASVSNFVVQAAGEDITIYGENTNPILLLRLDLVAGLIAMMNVRISVARKSREPR